jgi:hypothetical protein
MIDGWVAYKLGYVFFGSYKSMQSDIRIHVCTKSIIKE